MRYLWLVLFVALTVRLLYAQQIEEAKVPPPLHTVAISERNFINLLSGRTEVIRHITTSPSGINGRPNEIIRATYGGNERVCVNTGAGPGASTTWNCVTLGAI